MPPVPPPLDVRERPAQPPPQRSARPRRSAGRPQDGGRRRLEGMRFRRALTLMAMTLLLPGSAQLVAGRRATGRAALRVFAGVVVTVLLLAGISALWPGVAFRILSSAFVLGILRLLLVVLAVGWALLFIDAWRLGQPLGLRRKQRLAVVGLNGVLCLTVAGSLLFASHLVGVQRGLVVSMFGDGVASAATHGRYNVLLLGGDSGASRWGLRPDSITLASVDEETGRAILFGLPRNMSGFTFKPGSVMAEQFPTGYDCDGCYLNSLATWAYDNPELFPRRTADVGVEATEEAVEGITGLDVNYYAMVNLQGFRRLVDAVGGVKLHVREPIAVGGIGGAITDYIKPGFRTLDGHDTLWFARSRVQSDDYSRMARQKCVMNAMLQQLSPSTVVTKFEDIAKASEELITTDLPASELGTFMQLAMRSRNLPVRTVSFVPPMIDTGDPDVELIHRKVREAISASQALDDGGSDGDQAQPGGRHRKAAQHGGKAPGGEMLGGSYGSLSDGYVANSATDLGSAC